MWRGDFDCYIERRACGVTRSFVFCFSVSFSSFRFGWDLEWVCVCVCVEGVFYIEFLINFIAGCRLSGLMGCHLRFGVGLLSGVIWSIISLSILSPGSQLISWNILVSTALGSAISTDLFIYL